MLDFSKTPLFLAPLAGYSDLPLRGVVKRFGCDATISEMISSNALAYANEKTLKMVEKNELESPYFVQISGNSEEIVKKAVLVLNKFDFIDGIDLNCGCPAKKVVAHGSGSSLLKDLDKFASIIETIKKHSNKRYTSVKTRLGFDQDIAPLIVEKAQNAGADFIAMHGRTKAQGYTGNSNFKALKRAKEVAKIPFIANGDIDSKNFKFVLETTKADALMIGRASIGNPWIFYEIKSGKSIDKETKKEIILYHFEEMVKFYSNYGVVLFRKHLHRYSKGLELASEFRNLVNRISSIDETRKIIDEFFS